MSVRLMPSHPCPLEQAQIITNDPAFGAGSLLLRDLQPVQSLGRTLAGLRDLFQDSAGDAREPPSRVDKQRLRPSRLHPELPVPLLLDSPPQARRRMQFVCRVSAISGLVARRTRRSLPTQSARCVPARHVPIESPPPVENVLDGQTWMRLRDDVPPLLLKEVTTVSDPARIAERSGHPVPFARPAELRNAA